MTYAIYQEAPDSEHGLVFYGGAREFWRYKGQEVVLSGPYETGKTIGALTKLHALLCKYPGCMALMVRKTYKSLVQTAAVSYEKKVLVYPPGHPNCPIRKIGGIHPEFYDYPNGSRIVLTGLDNADKTLSAEYDFIYINQLEEVTLDPYEKLVGRATGRAGNAPYPQVLSDCNPGPSTHWILNRKSLKLYEQRHEHNPRLYDQTTGEITEQGKLTMSVLDSLTGLRYKRGRKGLWVSAEGQVYDGYDPGLHLIPRFDIPPEWPRYRAIDFGYTNPFVCQWWAEDPDGRLYRYREIFMTQRTVKVHAEQIKRLSAVERIIFSTADHDAEDRATLRENGIQTVAAIKDISRGIQAVEERLKPAGDGKPRIFFLEDSLVEADPTLYREIPGDLHPLCTEQEFSSYVWPEGVDGKTKKEQPVDAYNHGMDCTRYMVMAVDGGKGRKGKLKKENPIFG